MVKKIFFIIYFIFITTIIQAEISWGVCNVEWLYLKKEPEITSPTIIKLNISDIFEIKKSKPSSEGIWYFIDIYKDYKNYQGWIYDCNNNESTISIFNNYNEARLYHFDIFPLKKEIDDFFDFIEGKWVLNPDTVFRDGWSSSLEIYFEKINYKILSKNDYTFTWYFTKIVGISGNIYKFYHSPNLDGGQEARMYIEVIDKNTIITWSDPDMKSKYIRSEKRQNDEK